MKETATNHTETQGPELQFNVLTPEQLSAKTPRELAYWTWRKLSGLQFANVSGEIEAAINHATSNLTDKAALEPKAADIVENVFGAYVTHLSARTAKQLAMEAIGLMLEFINERAKSAN